MRDRKFSITSALSTAAHTEGATPNNRVACGLVNFTDARGGTPPFADASARLRSGVTLSVVR